MAGSSAQYAGNEDFRIRKTEDGRIRLHLAKDVVRVRDEYYAVDLNLEDLIAAAIMVANGNV
jgi:hypothetical protein